MPAHGLASYGGGTWDQAPLKWSSPGAAFRFMTRPHLVAGAPYDGGERDAPTRIHRIAVLTGDRIILVTTHSLRARHHLIRVAHTARLRYAVRSQGYVTC
jgi:hypothetical protein